MSLNTRPWLYVPQHAPLVVCPSTRAPGRMSLNTRPWSYVPQHDTLVVCPLTRAPGCMSLNTPPWSYVPQHDTLVVCPLTRAPGCMSLNTRPWSYVPPHAPILGERNRLTFHSTPRFLSMSPSPSFPTFPIERTSIKVLGVCVCGTIHWRQQGCLGMTPPPSPSEAAR